ncbi:MAG: YgfZ/GcvT domain-containing protein [Boseongicola sp.]
MQERTVFRLTGSDREEFLQNIVTNDVTRLKDGIVWAALLTPQGKYLADFFLVPAADAILLDVAREIAPALHQRLSMYRLRADVQIETTDINPTRGTGPVPDGAFDDPRHPELGWRAYDGRCGQNAEWTAIRVAHCIPETAIELIPSETYPLEAGFERLNGIDFKKGCYVGQEVTARMKHKTELKKGLAIVGVEGDAPPGTPILSQDGKPAGTLFSQANDQGIAYLRFDRSQGEMTALSAKIRFDG